jgi:competence transcription factor ComK
MLLDHTDVKFILDSAGKTQEVIISYNSFQEIEAFLARHDYFYNETVQKQLKKSEDDVESGRYIEVKPSNIEDAIAWLHE